MRPRPPFVKVIQLLTICFTLHNLNHIVKKLMKVLYCAFVSFEKAFDMVPRTLLWHQLLQNNITGTFFRIIYQIYHFSQTINNFCYFHATVVGYSSKRKFIPDFIFPDYLANQGCEGVAPMPDNQNQPYVVVVLCYMQTIPHFCQQHLKYI